VTELKTHDGVRLAFTSGKQKKLIMLESVPNAAVMTADGKNIYAAMDSRRGDSSLDEKAASPNLSPLTSHPSPRTQSPLLHPGHPAHPQQGGLQPRLLPCEGLRTGGLQAVDLRLRSKGDYMELVKDSRGRRVFPALPEDSLLLQKATVRVQHEGGQRFEPDSESAKTIADWIRQGMPYETPNQPALTGIEVTPAEKTYRKSEAGTLEGHGQIQRRLDRDVTALTDYISSEKAIATVDEDRVACKTTSESGETVIVARYMGMVAISRVAVPADKLSAAGALCEAHRAQRDRQARLCPPAKARPPAQRHVHRCGVPAPQHAGCHRHAADGRRGARLHAATRIRRSVSSGSMQLLERPEWADHWAIKWGDLIRPNPSRVGVKPVYLLDQWIRQSFRENKPWDQLRARTPHRRGQHAQGRPGGHLA
jgi:hypothetical protein